MPILVKNRAAKILFGNIKAEKVYSSYRQQMLNKNHELSREDKVKDSTARFKNLDGSVNGFLSSSPSNAHKSLQSEGKQSHAANFNSYQIWLIFLKLLLQQGKNSPLKFEITVDSSLDTENGKFEMVSSSLPCYRIMCYHPSTFTCSMYNFYSIGHFLKGSHKWLVRKKIISLKISLFICGFVSLRI